MKIEKINNKIYAYREALDQHKTGKSSVDVFEGFTMHKPKLASDVFPDDRLTMDECLHIIIDKSDKAKILKDYEKLYKKPFKPAKSFFGGACFPFKYLINVILNSKTASKEYGIYYPSTRMNFFDMSPRGDWKGDFYLYKLDDLKVLELTKKEKEWMEENSKKETRAKFNGMVAKDVIVDQMNKKEHDYTIIVEGNRYLKCNKIRGWNKLLKDSIEYYLNNVVLKDVGCKIKVPKQTSAHKFTIKDTICDLGEAKLEFDSDYND